MMKRKHTPASLRGTIILLLVLLNGITISAGYTYGQNWYWGLIVFLPLLLIAIPTIRRKKHTVLPGQHYGSGTE